MYHLVSLDGKAGEGYSWIQVQKHACLYTFCNKKTSCLPENTALATETFNSLHLSLEHHVEESCNYVGWSIVKVTHLQITICAVSCQLLKQSWQKRNKWVVVVGTERSHIEAPNHMLHYGGRVGAVTIYWS